MGYQGDVNFVLHANGLSTRSKKIKLVIKFLQSSLSTTQKSYWSSGLLPFYPCLCRQESSLSYLPQNTGYLSVCGFEPDRTFAMKRFRWLLSAAANEAQIRDTGASGLSILRFLRKWMCGIG